MAKIQRDRLSIATCFKASEMATFQADYPLSSLELSHSKLLSLIHLRRGTLIEISGSKSSGKTSLSHYILAESISKGETCACVDLHNQFDPFSFLQIGAALDQLSWVRCSGNMEHSIRSTDLLVHAGGFGVVLLNLTGATPNALNKIPISYWYRFRRAIENTPTILLICSDQICTGMLQPGKPQVSSCASSSLKIDAGKFHWLGENLYSLLTGLEITASPRKAVASVKITSIRPESFIIPAPVISTPQVQPV